jgi:hypothetical protein
MTPEEIDAIPSDNPLFKKGDAILPDGFTATPYQKAIAGKPTDPNQSMIFAGQSDYHPPVFP